MSDIFFRCIQLSFVLCAVFFRVETSCAEPFTTVVEGRTLTLPRDHGSHPEFRTEWWYLTGILRHDSGAAPIYGFQLTFFRRTPGEAVSPQSEQIFLAHAAISDLADEKFYAAHHVSKGGLGIAGAELEDLDVWHHDWKLERIGNEASIAFTVPRPGNEPLTVRLLGVLPQPLLHGNGGFSKKGFCSDCASYYYSLPGISLRGEVRLGSERRTVVGRAWFDHEFMSRALSDDQEGWDWFSLLGRDGSALMLFRVRGANPAYAGTFRERPDGPARTLDSVTIEELDTWVSPQTGTRYPSKWKLSAPGIPAMTLTPLLAAQEMPAVAGMTPSYWEGAISSSNGEFEGYAELTGYGEKMGEAAP